MTGASALPICFFWLTNVTPVYCAPTGTLKVLHGQGMPSPRHHDPGNLYIRLNVKFPETLTEEQMAGLERSLPPRRALPKPPAKLHIEEVTLQEPSERQKMQNDPDAMDEDDDDEAGPRAGVQCAQREYTKAGATTHACVAPGEQTGADMFCLCRIIAKDDAHI